MMISLKNQVALVTGGSSGIGYACARALAEAGASVVINYHSQAKPAEELAAKICQQGGKAIAVGGDVSKEEDVTTCLPARLRLSARWIFWWRTPGCKRMPRLAR